MPRRPRLSLPIILKEAREGYVLWNTDGQMIDHNAAFEEITGTQAKADEFAADLIRQNKDRGPIPVPQSVFQGEVVQIYVEVRADKPEMVRLDAWSITDDQGQIIAALGRVRPATDQEKTAGDEPERYWGLKLSSELHKRRASQDFPGFGSLIGQGPAHQQILRQMRAAIQARSPVVIAGEPGSGRHHLARLIHSEWQKGREKRTGLVPLDPYSLPSEILARDFLGVAPGKKPVWNVPDGSTILFETLDGLDVHLQQVIIAASGNVNLIGLIAARSDFEKLLPEFRALVEVLVIETVPLRNRTDELPLLAQSVLERLGESTGRQVDGFSASALEMLQLYDWPGNWRDLERVVRESIENATGPLITADEIPAWIQGSYGGAWMKTPQRTSADNLEEALVQTRKASVQQALKQYGDNKAAVARALGISRPKLYRLLAELGLEETGDGS